MLTPLPAVLDAGAVLAYLQGEPGGELVRQLIDAADCPLFAHALNMCEVYYHFARQEKIPVALVPAGQPRTIDLQVARDAVATIETDGVLVRTDLDPLFCEDAAQLKAIWRRVSLADCCGLALARRLDGEFFTTDRHELEPLQNAGVARIVFVR